MAADRVRRACSACSQVDDHPHHTFAAVRSLTDGELSLGVASYHMDCCSARGCPDGSCDVILASAGDKRGHDLLTHIVRGNAAKAIAGWQAAQVIS